MRRYVNDGTMTLAELEARLGENAERGLRGAREGAQGKRVPELVDLGEAAEVDARAASYRDAASHGSPLQIDIFDEGDIEDAQEILRRRGERLREMILTPVTKRLAGAGALLIAPDGNLNLVAFGSLPYEKGPLLRRFRISYLSCGRDLIRFRESSQPSGEPCRACPRGALGPCPNPRPLATNTVSRPMTTRVGNQAAGICPSTRRWLTSITPTALIPASATISHPDFS